MVYVEADDCCQILPSDSPRMGRHTRPGRGTHKPPWPWLVEICGAIISAPSGVVGRARLGCDGYTIAGSDAALRAAALHLFWPVLTNQMRRFTLTDLPSSRPFSSSVHRPLACLWLRSSSSPPTLHRSTAMPPPRSAAAPIVTSRTQAWRSVVGRHGSPHGRRASPSAWASGREGRHGVGT